MANRVVFDVNGLRVSEPGWNVLTAGRKNLLFDSKDRAYHIVAMGTISSHPSWQTWSSVAQYRDVLHGYTFTGLPSAMFMFDYGYWWASSPYRSNTNPSEYQNRFFCEFNRISALRYGDSQYIPGLHVAFQAFSAQIMSDRIRFFRSSICVIEGEFHTFGDLPTLPPVKYALIETGF